jgi:hypothetical protein
MCVCLSVETSEIFTSICAGSQLATNYSRTCHNFSRYGQLKNQQYDKHYKQENIYNKKFDFNCSDFSNIVLHWTSERKIG